MYIQLKSFIKLGTGGSILYLKIIFASRETHFLYGFCVANSRPSGCACAAVLSANSPTKILALYNRHLISVITMINRTSSLQVWPRDLPFNIIDVINANTLLSLAQ